MKFSSNKNKFLKQTIFIVFFSLLFSMNFSLHANAAEIFFGTHEKEVGVGQTFEVGVFLQTAKESVNAVSSTITFPKDMLTVSDIRDGNSIINMWIEKPKIAADAATGAITFSGIVPGGYTGDQGYLFSIIFTAQKAGTIKVSASNESILLNDGEGTSASITKAPLNFTITQEVTTPNFTPPEDIIPPESFTPKVTHDPSLFDDQYFLAFVTDDKQSGIDHYEVKEGFWHKFTAAESPYILKNQSLTSKIKVRAIDRSGNIRTESVAAAHIGYKTVIFFSILVLFVGFLAYRFFVGKKTRRKYHGTHR